MPRPDLTPLKFPQSGPGRRDVANLHVALTRLGLDVAPTEVSRGELGETTTDAVRELQKRTGLRVNGRIDSRTVDALNVELQHAFFAESKPRMQKVHRLLARLGHEVDGAEAKERKYGTSTEGAINAFKQAQGLPQDGRVTAEVFDRLEAAALETRFATKTQIAELQRTLLRVARIAKIDARIDPEELKGRQLGETTSAFISAVQRKYGLEATGKLDPVTYDRVRSIAGARKSRVKTLSVKTPDGLTLVRGSLRLNMTGEDVGSLQRALAYKGYAIDRKEATARTFGKSTREAVLSFQRDQGLRQDGHVQGATRRALNGDIGTANPKAASGEHRYRVRGCLRDDLWRGKAGVTVQVCEETLRGTGPVLAERTTLDNGFFDVPYDPPLDPSSGAVRKPFRLCVQVRQADGTVAKIKTLVDPPQVAWANSTDGKGPYRGTSVFERHMKLIGEVLRGMSIAELEESDDHHDISFVARDSGLPLEEVMRFVLAHKAAQALETDAAPDVSRISPDVFYAFIAQNLPPALPGDLIMSTEGWRGIDALVENTVNGIVFMDSDLQCRAFDNAAGANLIPIETVRSKQQVLGSLTKTRWHFALVKPILVGEGSLQALLENSKVPERSYVEVAQAFLQHQGLGEGFWSELRSNGGFGGAAAVDDLEVTVRLAHVAQSDMAVVKRLKPKLVAASPIQPDPVSTVAKLSRDEWMKRIRDDDIPVPDDPGVPESERLDRFARKLATRSEQLYPAIALAATVGRLAVADAGLGLEHLADVQAYLDAFPRLDLRAVNVDKHAAEQEEGIQLGDEALAELKLLQRVHRITSDAASAATLLAEKLNSAGQVVALGRERLISTLDARGMDERTASSIHAYAEAQYAQALARMAEYRNELQSASPRAIASQTLDIDDPGHKELVGSLPDLETLFGPTGIADTAASRSLYSPAAYLADVLDFLGNHPSERAGKSVRDLFFERRPDIANIKFNGDNTDTPLPYIDLVCEVLEAAVAAPRQSRDFGFQTTRTPEELTAVPEHMRSQAYVELRKSDFPVNGAFDVWQEETRLLLEHLGVPRHQLMATFQAKPSSSGAAPADASIAAEYFGLSTHAAALTTTPAMGAALENVWGFGSSTTEVPIADFLRRSGLQYAELLELISVEWLGTPGPALQILPADNPDSGEQRLVHLSPERLDRMQRFLRLWRATGWRMWELDRLIRAPRIGNGLIDGGFLVQLKRFGEITERLGLAFEPALSLFGDIDFVPRPDPFDHSKTIPSLFAALFRNPTVATGGGIAVPTGTDPKMTLPKPALLAAFSIAESDLSSLIANAGLAPVAASVDGEIVLTLSEVSRMYDYVNLANGLGVPLDEVLSLRDLAGLGNIFASPKDTLDFCELYDLVAASGFEMGELEYILCDSCDAPASQLGPREETVDRFVSSLAGAVRGLDPVKDSARYDRAITTHVAATFALADEQAGELLTGLLLDGVSLMTRLGDPAARADMRRSYRLLHKVTLLVQRLGIGDPADLRWLLQPACPLGALDLSSLPVGKAPAQPLLPRWLTLQKWVSFQARFPLPAETTLREVFDKAAKLEQGELKASADDVLGAIHDLTGWDLADLKALHEDLGLRQEKGGTATDYVDIETYLRLSKCIEAAKRLGVSAETALSWRDREPDDPNAEVAAATVEQIRQCVKAKYPGTAWQPVIASLQSNLRERKRDALIAFLVEYSLRNHPEQVTFGSRDYRNPEYWEDADDLLSYFLIDVQMGSGQATSRIKQAMSSVQMFVQRCFLNLEQPWVQVSREDKQDGVSLNSWRQWTWMKNYRIWEANRKIFLYPENWIEPELRDDKSPFFEELESELMQGDLTQENAEAAFLHYLEKVHEVSRIEITGVYHEIDDMDPYDDLPPQTNLLHVVGRTKADPPVHYYRCYDLNYDSWTAWESIDVDIAGEHAVPVVYNRRLYLFWLVFIEKLQKTRKRPPSKPTSGTSDAPEPPKQLEIQLAWSCRQDGGWTPKRLSRERLIHPWERPLRSYHLHPRYKKLENHLWLDVYISTSPEFNDTRFYDPYTDTREYMTATRFDEAARPWHSSSFVFDGTVIESRLKPLLGSYHMPEKGKGQLADQPTRTTSYEYVHEAFGEAGKGIDSLRGRYETAPRLALPDGMHYDFNRLANNKAISNSSQMRVLDRGATRTLLSGARTPFEVVVPQDRVRFETSFSPQVPFLYQDRARAYFIKPDYQDWILGLPRERRPSYTFRPFHHPFTPLFIRELNRSGPDGLLTRRMQSEPQSLTGQPFDFRARYSPCGSTVVDETAAVDIVDFRRYGAYSIYNWEIFFHAPLLIACKLNQNQRFEEAMRWFHYIFDPTNVDALATPARFWVTKPFFEQNSESYRLQRLKNLLDDIETNLDQVRMWRNHPFSPHAIARYRPVAYQRMVVMRYIDNVIDWGDQLFRRDTMESINEAVMLYVIAHELLGPRPPRLAASDKEALSYKELVQRRTTAPKDPLELFEGFVHPPAPPVRVNPEVEPLPRFDLDYFGIPANAQMLGYWNTVEDRLFKIRHGMNIAGVKRKLPLFEPPIDPALLVRAAAAGIDLDNVLNDVAGSHCPYRFRYLVAKALEFTGEVRGLGDMLLATLEKQDAEGIALLRSVHETKLLEASRQVRKSQIEDAEKSIAGLEQAKVIAEARRDYYAGKELMSPFEMLAMDMSTTSLQVESGIAIAYLLASVLRWIPRFDTGSSGMGPHAVAEIVSGDKIATTIEDGARVAQNYVNVLDKGAGLLSTIAGYFRRQEEWVFQADLAAKEIVQIERQLEGAQIRLAMAERELENLDLQIDQAKTVDEYMRSKYTNQQLYGWMLRQIAGVYFQAYKLAFDMARRAEKSLQLELGNPKLAFVEFGYWDSLKKGLLSAQKLGNDIRRMEAAYVDSNTRELEITKHVSLAQVHPVQLLKLKAEGSCTVGLPEWLFDMDYPGHYMRRIKSVSISVPCVAGPYSNVNCTLSLTESFIRTSDSPGDGYGDPFASPDARFIGGWQVTHSIATSHGREDTGTFELTFNDERYLPFEGAGAVSRWEISMPKKNNQFDFDSIADVVLHVRYTARPATLRDHKDAAIDNLKARLPEESATLLTLSSEFGGEWHRFFQPAAGQGQALKFTLGSQHFPFYARNEFYAPRGDISATKVWLVVDTPLSDLAVTVQPPGSTAPLPMPKTDGMFALDGLTGLATGDWILGMTKSGSNPPPLTPADVRSAALVVGFRSA